jgi:hypothetical protein
MQGFISVMWFLTVEQLILLRGLRHLAGVAAPSVDRKEQTQFRGDSLADYDQMVALEDRLIEELGQSAKVDGHDSGSGEINIFIFTSDPAATFWRVRQTLQQEGRLDSVTVAHRPVDGERYTVIWPEGSMQEFKVV